MRQTIAVSPRPGKPLAAAHFPLHLAGMTLSARLCALVVFCLAALSLRLQFDASLLLMNNPPATAVLWAMAGYFTILTNLGVALAMMAVAWKWRMSSSFAAGLTLSILTVWLIYHALLAQLWKPEGLDFWADQGLHTGVPLLMVLWWAAFAPKDVGLHDLPKWLIWPTVYVAYALIRGQVTGTYPYPFLDAGALGWARTAINLAGFLLGFGLLGLGLILLARRSPR